MDSNKLNTMILLLPFLVIGGPIFFVWIGLDIQKSRKYRYEHMHPHLHHVLLGFWPFIMELLVFLFYGKTSSALSLILLAVTGLCYLLGGLYDVWYEAMMSYRPERLSALPDPLTRIALYYPILTLFFIGFPATWLSILGGLTLLLHLPSTTRSFLSILWAASWLLSMYLIQKLQKIWQMKAKSKYHDEEAQHYRH